MKRFYRTCAPVRSSVAGFVLGAWSVVCLFAVLAWTIPLLTGTAWASPSVAIYQVSPTVTAAPQATQNAPSPVATNTTGNAPLPVTTSQAPTGSLPVPVETPSAQAQIATQAASKPTANTSLLPSDDPSAQVPTPASATGGSVQPGAGSTAASGTFPWLPVILLVAAFIGGLIFVLSRRRTPVVESTVRVLPGTVAPAHTPYNPGVGSVGTTATQKITGTVPVEPPVAAAPPAPFIAPVGDIPSTLDCPNCGTSNAINENFCHECGQDLRPTRASLVAAITPTADVSVDNMPYLETVDRVDEQLEYVLSRPKILIGTAVGSDIVIDSLFKGWQSVDPQHAELRREQDGFVVVDRGSESGTFVNEMRTGENLLADGDVIRVGDVQFIFRVPA